MSSRKQAVYLYRENFRDHNNKFCFNRRTAFLFLNKLSGTVCFLWLCFKHTYLKYKRKSALHQIYLPFICRGQKFTHCLCQLYYTSSPLNVVCCCCCQKLLTDKTNLCNDIMEHKKRLCSIATVFLNAIIHDTLLLLE